MKIQYDTIPHFKFEGKVSFRAIHPAKGWQHWKIVERVHNNGKVYVNLLRKGQVKTLRVR